MLWQDAVLIVLIVVNQECTEAPDPFSPPFSQPFLGQGQDNVTSLPSNETLMPLSASGLANNVTSLLATTNLTNLLVAS